MQWRQPDLCAPLANKRVAAVQSPPAPPSTPNADLDSRETKQQQPQAAVPDEMLPGLSALFGHNRPANALLLENETATAQLWSWQHQHQRPPRRPKPPPVVARRRLGLQSPPPAVASPEPPLSNSETGGAAMENPD